MESNLYFTHGLAGVLKVKESKVLVISTEASRLLSETIISCARASGINPANIKTFQIDNESQDSLDHLLGDLRPFNAVIIASTSLENAVKINDTARRVGVPSIYCNITDESVVIFGDGGGLTNQINEEGFTRLDSAEVNVGAVNADCGNTTVVTCNRPHGLRAGDTVAFGSRDGEKFSVESVVSETGMTVKGKVGEVTAGARVFLVGREEYRQNDACLKDAVDGSEYIFQPSRRRHDCLASCLVGSGLIVQQLINLITKRFPSENKLALVPLCEEGQLSALKGMSILVSGSDLLAFTLVRELIRAEVWRIVVLDYGSSVSQFDVANCSDLSNNHVGQSKAEAIASLHRNVSSVKADLQDKDACETLWNEADLVISCGGSFDERRTVDYWCVELTKPLIDAAVDGMKGQVESVVPHKTINYAGTSDPTDKSDPPYCVLKSFPHLPEHAVLWSGEKIKHLLVDKPNVFNKFLEEYEGAENAEKLKEGFGFPEGAVVAYKMGVNLFAKKKPGWEDCVAFARIKFEKYFNHKAKQLVSSFPEDTLLTSGDKFWSWPKLIPKPVVFSSENEVHVKFVRDLAIVIASLCGVESSDKTLIEKINEVEVPQFVPKNKAIVTDESVKAEDDTSAAGSDELQVNELIEMLEKVEGVRLNLESVHAMESVYSDLLASMSILRCDMYSIGRPTIPEIYKCKNNLQSCCSPMVYQTCGRALSEACRILSSSPTATNWWMGESSVSSVVSATAQPPPLTHLTPTLAVTLWDKLEIRGDPSWTLQQFLDAIKQKYKVEVTMVVQDSRMVYVPFMPGHKARLPKLMTKLIKPNTAEVVKLSVTAAVEGEEEDVSLPPVKYYVK